MATISARLLISTHLMMVTATAHAMPNIPVLTDNSSVTIKPLITHVQLDGASLATDSDPLSAEAINQSVALSDTSQSAAKDKLAQSQIIDLATGEVLTPEQFVAQLARQDYVILGEYHDSEAQHKLVYWLLDSLNEQRKQGSLLLEMMNVDQQANIDRVAQSMKLVQLTEPPAAIDLSQLKQALAWQSSWDWQLYGDIAAHPIEHRYPLIATNLTKSEVATMMQEAVPLPVPISVSESDSTSQAVKATIKDSILANHNLDNASDEDMMIIDKMVEIQQHRDRRMAEQLLSAPTPSLLLVGNFHAQKAIGVPVHLSDLQYNQADKKQGKVVMMVNSLDDLEADRPTDDADYAWIIADD